MKCWKLVVLLSLTACGDSTGLDAERAALASEYAAWQKLGITSYDFTYQQLCFCAPEATQPVRLQVRNGVLTAAFDSVGVSIPSSRWYTFKTVDQIFQLLIQHASQTGHTLKNLTFDDSLHYPTHATGDIANTADAGFDIRAKNLSRSP